MSELEGLNDGMVMVEDQQRAMLILCRLVERHVDARAYPEGFHGMMQDVCSFACHEGGLPPSRDAAHVLTGMGVLEAERITSRLVSTHMPEDQQAFLCMATTSAFVSYWEASKHLSTVDWDDTVDVDISHHPHSCTIERPEMNERHGTASNQGQVISLFPVRPVQDSEGILRPWRADALRDISKSMCRLQAAHMALDIARYLHEMENGHGGGDRQAYMDVLLNGVGHLQQIHAAARSEPPLACEIPPAPREG